MTMRFATGMIEYDFFVSRFGPGWIAGTASGICAVAFADASDVEAAGELERQNPGRRVIHAPGRFAAECRHLFSPGSSSCELDLRGSAFQIEVWSELRSIPIGQTISYRQLAQRLGYPGAARAVGNAVAKNRIACLVPCHRVIRADGAIGGYRWGPDRKAALLAWEADNPAGSQRVQ